MKNTDINDIKQPKNKEKHRKRFFSTFMNTTKSF